MAHEFRQLFVIGTRINKPLRSRMTQIHGARIVVSQSLDQACDAFASLMIRIDVEKPAIDPTALCSRSGHDRFEDYAPFVLHATNHRALFRGTTLLRHEECEMHAGVGIRIRPPDSNVALRQHRDLDGSHRKLIESARDLWRLQPLRRWSHEQVEQVLT